MNKRQKDKELEELKIEVYGLNPNNVIGHIIFSIVISLFLGSTYYIYKWKIAAMFLIFFLGYGALGILIVLFTLAVKIWALRKIKEKERIMKLNKKFDDLDF